MEITQSTGEKAAAPIRQGWGKPGAANKFHFFYKDIISVCHHWMWGGDELEDTQHNHVDNCKACIKKRLSMVAKGEIKE